MKLLKKENNAMFIGETIEGQELVFSVVVTHSKGTTVFNRPNDLYDQTKWLKSVTMEIERMEK
jgi:hypothetical protein